MKRDNREDLRAQASADDVSSIIDALFAEEEARFMEQRAREERRRNLSLADDLPTFDESRPTIDDFAPQDADEQAEEPSPESVEGEQEALEPQPDRRAHPTVSEVGEAEPKPEMAEPEPEREGEAEPLAKAPAEEAKAAEQRPAHQLAGETKDKDREFAALPGTAEQTPAGEGQDQEAEQGRVNIEDTASLKVPVPQVAPVDESAAPAQTDAEVPVQEAVPEFKDTSEEPVDSTSSLEVSVQEADWDLRGGVREASDGSEASESIEDVDFDDEVGSYDKKESAEYAATVVLDERALEQVRKSPKGRRRRRRVRDQGAPREQAVSQALTEAVGEAETLASPHPRAHVEDLAQREAEEPLKAEPSEEALDQEAIGRSAALMSALVIISRITGFFRTWGQAMALGVTVTASCYTVANNLPNQLYELVMGGMLATAFLPVYLSVKQRGGRKASNEYTSNLLSIVLLAMGVLTVLGLVFAGPIVWTQSFGANADFDFDLAVYFFRFFAIEIVLYALSSVISGVLNAERDYFWSNAAPIFNNLVCTASFFLYAYLAGTNPRLALLILAVGNPLGVAIQVIMQWPSLKRHGIRLTPHINLHDPSLIETLSIGIPSLVVTICSFVTVSVQTSSALSVTVSGSSIAYYTRIWYTLPYSIFAVPITTAMFTELSNYVSKKDMKSCAKGVAFGTNRIMFVLIPFALYLMVFSVPLVTLMAAGKFEPDQIKLTADYLAVLAASLPFYGVCTFQQKVCSSLRRMNLYMVSIGIGSLMQVAFCLILTPLFGLMMVPLSSVAFFIMVDFVNFASLRRQLGSIGITSMLKGSAKALLLGGAGALVGALILWALPRVFGSMGASALRALIYTVVAGIPGVVVTFGLALALGLEEVSTLRRLIDRFLPQAEKKSA